MKQKGRLFYIEVLISGNYHIIAGMRSNSVTINGEAVDVTDKDGNGWRELLQGAGIQSATLKGRGIASSQTAFTLMQGWFVSGAIRQFRITTGTVVLLGAFQLASYEGSGEHNKEELFSFSMESSGALTEEVPESSYLLLEDGGYFLLEDDSGAILLE